MLGLDIAYLCTKLDDCSFSHSRDMVGIHQNINSSCDLTTPLSAKVCHPWAKTCYCQLPIKFEVSIYTHYKYMKDDTKWQKWGSSGLFRGHSRSLEIAPFDRVHTSSYQPSISNYVPILHHFWHIARYWPKIAYCTYPTSIWRPCCRWPHGISQNLWHYKSRIPALSHGVVCVILRLAIFVQYRCVTDKQTDMLIAVLGNCTGGGEAE